MLTPQQTFSALLAEASFTKELLGAGATQIRQANYARLGAYTQSFAALSVGLERIGKLCLVLDHYIQHHGKFPDFGYLKHQIGHKLELLYERAQEISKRRGIAYRFLPTLDHPLHQTILRVLHDYAEGDRYSNFNLLVGARQTNDPISSWFTLFDLYAFEHLVSGKKKERIASNAAEVGRRMSSLGVIFHVSETGQFIESYAEASFRTGLFLAVAPYRQLYVLQVIRFWVELLRELGWQAQRLGREEVPFFGEVFGAFYNGDSIFKSRRTWLL